MNEAQAVRQALVNPLALTSAEVPMVLGAGLGGWVWSQLPQGHAVRPLVQAQRMQLLARHMRVRARLLPLLRAWNGAGVEFMLLKGFAHAQFTHADPAQRFYGDVDVVIHERDARLAVQLAQNLGWQDDGFQDAPHLWTHEVAHLFSADEEVRLDVHRNVTARPALSVRKVQRATRAIWRGAQPRELEGVPVLVPDPHDQALMLALTRAWSGDAGNLKPADVLDYRALLQRYALTDVALEERAVTLGCLHTWRAFQRGLEGAAFGQASQAGDVRRASALDAHPQVLGGWPQRLAQVRPIVSDVLFALPYAWRVKRDLARGGDPRELVKATPVRVPQRPEWEVIVRSLRGSRWALKVVYPQGATCVPVALTSYRVLAARGVAGTFVSGVRRGPEGIAGHAWVELPGAINHDYGDPQARLYQELFRHTAGADTAGCASGGR